MKIHKILSLCFVIALTFVFSEAAQAQTKSRKAEEKQEIKMEKPVKGEKAEQAPAEQIEKMQKAEGAQAEKGQKKTRKDKSGKMDKEHKGKGHAYGHHKDGQSGKEFGQERAADAKDKEKIEQQKTLKKAKKEKSFERR